MSQLSRRAWLAAAGSSVVAAPWGPARAQASGGAAPGGPPQRLIIVYSPNGFLSDLWLPGAGVSPTNFVLGPTMQPIGAYHDQLVIVDGLANQAAIKGAGPAADRSMAALLTGRELANGATTGFASGSGISLDQAVGALSAGLMVAPPLVLGIGTAGVRATLATPSYAASRVPVLPTTDLADTTAKLFPPNPAGTIPSEPELRLALQQAAVMASQKNLAFLQSRVSAGDRRRLAQHADALGDVDTRLRMQASQCAPPAAVVGRNPARLLDAGRTCMDLVLAAFACDRARVATLVWEGANGNAPLAPDSNVGHHDLALAAAGGDTRARASLAAIESQFMAALAYLLDGLAQRSDGNGGGTLLANTLVLVCSDVASASPVSWQSMPCLLVGGAGGRLKTGRFLRVPGAPWNQLLTSVAQMMGAGDQFGDPKYGTGPLPGL